jgi:hypothetical protein
LSMIPRVEPEGMLFGKPVSTFPDHALGVSFQEVVHPVLNEEAEVVEALANPRRTEWTPIRMRL